MSLVEASDIYQEQLVEIMLPSMYKNFVSMRRESRNVQEFQRRLTAIPSWNLGQIEERKREALQTSELLEKIIAAVYLATVQVLAYVRLPGSKTDVKVKVPATTTFVHCAYKLAGRDLYEGIMEGQNLFQPSKVRSLRKVLATAVRNTVNKLLPLQQLLEAYVADEVDAQGMVSPEPFGGLAHAFPQQSMASTHARSELPPEMPERAAVVEEEETHVEPEAETDNPKEEPEENKPEAHEKSWLDDASDDGSEPKPAKRVDLSPRPVMCDEAGDAGELAA